MKRRSIPEAVLAKLAKFEQAVENLTQRVARTQDSIVSARQRLTGGFRTDQEYNDLYSTLKQLVADKPILERKLSAAEHRLSDCRAWLDALPDDAVLEPVKVKPNGSDLEGIRQRIKDAEDELKKLASVPVPSADIKKRIEDYVGSLARPRVSGIAKGETLRVSWPDDKISVVALLLGDRMVEVLSQQAERMANDPMPLAERNKRIGELMAESDILQRQELALDPETIGVPPEVILGVKVARCEPTKSLKRVTRAA
jgi:hypothetical protein